MKSKTIAAAAVLALCAGGALAQAPEAPPVPHPVRSRPPRRLPRPRASPVPRAEAPGCAAPTAGCPLT